MFMLHLISSVAASIKILNPSVMSATSMTVILEPGHQLDMCYRKITASGHDMHTLLFGFLDELLFIFSTEFLVLKEIAVSNFDQEQWCLEASGYVTPCSLS